ncbi:endonuclease YncB(thermonuclease family) [Rhizobium aquaticum]|uniref:Endonuclease YncB(Thermonuclease family) n=1 Tax=Rhizobium aquaticum TaxID=1549636 RepID=A0ABV2J2E1_9HYPH
MMRLIVSAALWLFVLTSSALAQDAVWTSKPVRVEPSRQNFERLPTLMLGVEGGVSISFPLRIDMQDSTSFAANGVNYQIKDLIPVASSRLCQTQAGVRWSCGKQASIFVGNLFRGKTLACKVERKADHIALSGCRDLRMEISKEIVAQGFAFPDGGNGDLQTTAMSARERRAGVWNDADCLNALHSC